MTFIYRQLSRFVATGFVALQVALVGTVVAEAVATQPQIAAHLSSAAYASNNSFRSAERSVVFVETDRGQGSGVVVDADGLIVTNAHVIEGASQVYVTVEGRQMLAEVVLAGNSRCLDLALLRVKGARNLSAIALGNIDSIYKTQTVYVIGFPGALPGDSATVTRGIVSNIYPQTGKLQLDGGINPGNSGGAVINENSQLVGIATSRLIGADSINFAVSVDKVSAFVKAYQQGSSPAIGRFVMPGSQPDTKQISNAITLDGTQINGTLQAGDSRFCGDSSLADLYSFEAEAG